LDHPRLTPCQHLEMVAKIARSNFPSKMRQMFDFTLYSWTTQLQGNSDQHAVKRPAAFSAFFKSENTQTETVVSDKVGVKEREIISLGSLRN
jgi:hypothetical protein